MQADKILLSAPVLLLDKFHAGRQCPVNRIQLNTLAKTNEHFTKVICVCPSHSQCIDLITCLKLQLPSLSVGMCWSWVATGRQIKLESAVLTSSCNQTWKLNLLREGTLLLQVLSHWRVHTCCIRFRHHQQDVRLSCRKVSASGSVLLRSWLQIDWKYSILY